MNDNIMSIVQGACVILKNNNGWDLEIANNIGTLRVTIADDIDVSIQKIIHFNITYHNNDTILREVGIESYKLTSKIDKGFTPLSLSVALNRVFLMLINSK